MLPIERRKPVGNAFQSMTSQESVLPHCVIYIGYSIIIFGCAQVFFVGLVIILCHF